MIWVDLEEPVDVEEPPPPLAPPVVLPEIQVAPHGATDIPDLDWISPDFWNPTPPVTGENPSFTDFVASSALPQLVFQARADYPELARRMRIEGTVMIHVLVDPSGRVDKTVVIQSVHPTLDKAAITAAKKCKFTPGKQRELNVKSWVAIPFRFKMN